MRTDYVRENGTKKERERNRRKKREIEEIFSLSRCFFVAQKEKKRERFFFPLIMYARLNSSFLSRSRC